MVERKVPMNRKVYMKIYREKHKKESSACWKEYYETHKIFLLNNKKKYRKDHQEKIRKQQQEYRKNRKKTDIDFKLRLILRGSISQLLKHNIKSGNTLKLVGCSIDKLKIYLESIFKPGMTWNNYGRGWYGKGMKEWHIDHIKPCASFDLSKPEEQARCFHYTNLQPLWAIDNIKKSNKVS